MKQLKLFNEEAKNFETPPYFEEPKTDNERLLNLQYNWLVNGDKKAKDCLWLEALDYAGKCLVIELKKEKRHIPYEVFEDEKMEAVLYLMRRFDQGTGYYVKKNFISAVYSAVIHAHKYRTDAQKVYRLAITLMNDSHLSWDNALIVARKQMDAKKEEKTGKKMKRNEIKPKKERQLQLWENIQ